ncbi:MAG: hypothetical protein ACTSUE_21730, partial [Promethearchaeota archaeon]
MGKAIPGKRDRNRATPEPSPASGVLDWPRPRAEGDGGGEVEPSAVRAGGVPGQEGITCFQRGDAHRPRAP